MHEAVWDAELLVLIMASSSTYGCLVRVSVVRKQANLRRISYIHTINALFYFFNKPTLRGQCFQLCEGVLRIQTEVTTMGLDTLFRKESLLTAQGDDAKGRPVCS